jgi:hypothetical protein
MNRKQLFSEVEELLANYCKGCFLHQHFKNEKGRRYAHRFCITKCTIGERIKQIGNKLS